MAACRLSRLQTLAVCTAAARVQRLPAGPWLETLQRLAAPDVLLAASLQELSAAPRLQRLAVGTTWDDTWAATESIVTWAASAAPLQQLALQLLHAAVPRGLFEATVELQRRRPRLAIVSCTSLNAVLDEWCA